jgi:DNA replication protein DnaC
MDRKEIYLQGLSPEPYLVFKEYDYQKRYESFIMIAEAICPSFILDSENKSIFENAIKYFAADPSSEFNLKKGIYLYGKIGSGKTLFFKIMAELNRATETGNLFKTITVSNIVDGFSKSGFESLKDFNSDAWGRVPHILLDDLGQSATSVKHFGSTTDIVSEFIQRRYYCFTENFKLTHISTNMEPGEIKNEYGEFVSSRMREMFNIILYPGTDKRK